MARFEYTKYLMVALPALMLGCASPKAAKQATYSETILDRPLPTDEVSRMNECASLESEVRRQQGAMGYAASLEPGSPRKAEVMATYHSNIGALKTREMQAGCGGRHAPPAMPSRMSH